MITTLYNLTVTTPKGEKLNMNFIDYKTMFEAHIIASNKGCETDCHSVYGYTIFRNADQASEMIDSFIK